MRSARCRGIGPKKAAPVELTQAQAHTLKTAYPDTPQGWRDALLMCLLLDHGLRVSEVYDLQLENLTFEEAKGWMKFYRRKVGKEQRHALTPDTLRTARAYVAARGPWAGQLMYGSEQSGALTGQPMSMRALNKRVRLLGEAAGVAGLSPHDCRHFWASAAATHTPARVLQEAGGWSSSATALRYQRAAAIANEGVVLPDDVTGETAALQRKARGRPPHVVRAKEQRP